MPQPFYSDEDVYRADIEAVWRRGWLFAGHSCEIPKAGDYFTLQVDTDSIIGARGDDGAIHVMHNVCRHRGSIVCTEAAGHAARLVCPYHQWTYRPDGTLLACRGMPDDLDKSQFGLRRIQVRDVEGLIFISLAQEPSSFEHAQELLAPGTRCSAQRVIRTQRSPCAWRLAW